MQKSILVLSDGTELSSGKGTSNALMNVKYTELVNDATELTLGSVCCSCIEATLIAPRGSLSIAAGTEVTVYEESSDDGTRSKTGVFTLEKPTRSSANTYKLIAYDHISKLDIDLTSWIQEQLPKTLYNLVNVVCEKCGVELENDWIPQGDTLIPAVPSGSITGRQILQWAAEISAQFVRATPEGKILFSWYKENNLVAITPGKNDDADIRCVPYFEGALSYEDYSVSSIEKVQIRNSEEDVGIVWPADQENGNTYIVDTNGLLMSCSTDDLQYVAQGIYQTLIAFTYVPCKVSIPRGSGIRAGDIVSVIDVNGVAFKTCIMSRTVSGGKEDLESTGSPVRDCSTAVNSREYTDLEKRVLKLNISVDGLKVENRNLADDYSQLELTVKGIGTEVGNAKGDISKLQQTAGQVLVSVEDDMGVLSTVINADKWETKYVDVNGNEISGMHFDPEEKMFVFNGSGHYTGSLNIADKFIVDLFGNAKIYGGKYYAMDEDGNISNYTSMDKDGFTVYSSEGKPVIKIGFPENDTSYPYIRLYSADGTDEESALYKKFSNGFWTGNDAPADASGYFEAKDGYLGMFYDFTDGEVYVVNGRIMKSIYTGESIARFG